MIRFKKLSHKLLIAFLVISVGPLLIMTWMSLTLAKDAIEKQAFHQLEAVRAIKANQIMDFFEATKSELRLVKDDPNLQKIHEGFIKAFTKAGNQTDSPLWKGLAKAFQANADNIIAKTQWVDMYMIDPEGHIIFTHAKNPDSGMNLATSELSKSSLGRLFSEIKAKRTDDILISDFAPYAPANNEPAAFMMGEITSNIGGILKGYFALRIPLEKINRIMQQRNGMGETGETYLVGTDNRMRSDSILNPTDHSVKASFSGTAKDHGVDTIATKLALSGRAESRILTDYKGNVVLSSFAPLQFGNHTWALIAEIHESEALEALHLLLQMAIVTFVITIIVIVIIAFWIARGISQPLSAVSSAAAKIAQGDLTVKVNITQADEVGILESAMMEMVNRLRAMINHVAGSANQQAAAAEQLSSITDQTKTTVSDQQAATDQVASAITEMSASISEVSQLTAGAANASKSVSLQMVQSSETVTNAVREVQQLSRQTDLVATLMQALEQGTTRIGGILDVIKGIADQTNLLALNAAIEAARAGEQGRGFAVVADEVRSLAQNTQNSAAEIDKMIGQLQSDSHKSVAAMHTGVKQTEVIVSTITEVSEKLVSCQQAVDQISDMGIQISTAAEEQSSASNEINRNAIEISQLAVKTGESAIQISTASDELASLAVELNHQVSQFKI
jgi:methyl-accepting chemotaxis protein